MEETDLTFDRAVSIATARETASKDVQAMISGSVNYVPGSQSGDQKYKWNVNIKNKNLHRPNNVSISTKFAKPTNSNSSSYNSNAPKTLFIGCVGYIGNVIVFLKVPLAMVVNKRLNLDHPQRNLKIV